MHVYQRSGLWETKSQAYVQNKGASFFGRHSSLLETCIEHIFLSVVLVETRQQVGVDSFGLGILVGVFGTISTIAAVLHRWLQFRFFLSLKKGLV